MELYIHRVKIYAYILKEYRNFSECHALNYCQSF